MYLVSVIRKLKFGERRYGKENAVRTLQRKNKWGNEKLRCIFGLD